MPLKYITDFNFSKNVISYDVDFLSVNDKMKNSNYRQFLFNSNGNNCKLTHMYEAFIILTRQIKNYTRKRGHTIKLSHMYLQE